MTTGTIATSWITAFLAFFLLTGTDALAQAPGSGRTQVRFTGPSGMQIRWYYKTSAGREGYSEPALEAPARYNFRQGGGYRLKLSNLPGHPGLELYPTLEVWAPAQGAQQFRIPCGDCRADGVGCQTSNPARPPRGPGHA